LFTKRHVSSYDTPGIRRFAAASGNRSKVQGITPTMIHVGGIHAASRWIPLVLVIVMATGAARGQAPRALAPGEAAPDRRLGPPRHLDGEHPFHTVTTVTEWVARRDLIRRRVAVSAGLWPMPARESLEPVIHGRIDMGDYTVEKVFFESLPGHWVTGNLYRPNGDTCPRPGVLCPHGHWPGGRFMDAGVEVAARQIAVGAERFISGGRSPLQARCVGLARLGCVVFHYDMLGFADSVQFPSHRPACDPTLDGREAGTWGFGGFAASARLQTTFGLQTFNSVRALDFVASLPDVDPRRIAVTGGSGGATQTLMLTALDDRVAAAFPSVMVSTGMQGGCTCENSHFLRIGQGNVDIAAVAAPRPLGLTTADDWTRNFKDRGWPDLVNVYRLTGTPDAVEAHFDVQFPHNFNAVARGHLLAFLARHFQLDPDAATEKDFEFLSADTLTVWGGQHPPPSGDAVGAPHQRHVCRAWMNDSAAVITPLLAPHDGDTLAEARRIIGGAWQVILGRGVPAASAVEFVPVPGQPATGMRSRDGHTTLAGLVRLPARNECVPVAIATSDRWNGTVVILPHPRGKDGLYEADGAAAGEPGPRVKALLDRGFAVITADLFGQGEFTADGTPLTDNPRVFYPGPFDHAEERWRIDPVYFYGYNDGLFVKRVHDLLTLLAFARNLHGRDDCRVAIVGLEAAGHWVLGALTAAKACGDVAPVHHAFVDTGGFRFADVPSVWHADFLPGALKYGDISGMLAVVAPTPLVLVEADGAVRQAACAAWEAAGSADAIRAVESATVDDWFDVLSADSPQSP